MGVTYKPVGHAVAVAKGHYPLRDGRHVSIKPGQTFEIFEGLDKGKWFTVLKTDEPAPPPPAPPAPPPAEPDTLAGAAVVERKRKAATRPPTADEIA